MPGSLHPVTWIGPSVSFGPADPWAVLQPVPDMDGSNQSTGSASGIDKIGQDVRRALPWRTTQRRERSESTAEQNVLLVTVIHTNILNLDSFIASNKQSRGKKGLLPAILSAVASVLQSALKSTLLVHELQVDHPASLLHLFLWTLDYLGHQSTWLHFVGSYLASEVFLVVLLFGLFLFLIEKEQSLRVG